MAIHPSTLKLLKPILQKPAHVLDSEELRLFPHSGWFPEGQARTVSVNGRVVLTSMCFGPLGAEVMRIPDGCTYETRNRFTLFAVSKEDGIEIVLEGYAKREDWETLCKSISWQQ
jgi:hypothetical protein